MSSTQPIMIVAGGTGGHVFPALAVARALQAQDVPVVWLGTAAGLESRVVPAAGIQLEQMDIVALRGKGLMALLRLPLRLLRAVNQARRVLRQYRPRAVLAMGGFVAGPGGLAAWLSRVPLVVHEQNAIPGLTNRCLAHIAQKLLQAMPGAFPAARAQCVGNPLRAGLSELPTPAQRFAGRQGRLRLLVIGGSQGATGLNQLLPAALAQMAPEARPDVWHQVGDRHLQATQQAYSAAGVEGRLASFIEDMAEPYGWADLVLCRAGAMTVAELAAVGVGSILVPFPQAVDDHQTHNGRWLVDAQAALMVQQRDLTAAGLAEQLTSLAADRSALLHMAEAARGLARTDATEVVARMCLEVVR